MWHGGQKPGLPAGSGHPTGNISTELVARRCKHWRSWPRVKQLRHGKGGRGKLSPGFRSDCYKVESTFDGIGGSLSPEQCCISVELHAGAVQPVAETRLMCRRCSKQWPAVLALVWSKSLGIRVRRDPSGDFTGAGGCCGEFTRRLL